MKRKKEPGAASAQPEDTHEDKIFTAELASTKGAFRQARLKAGYLAERGFHVFPCGTDKRPTTAHGFYDATNDPGVVERLWRCRPGSLIGLPTGAVNGFDVLDIDPDGMGWRAANAHRLPATLTVATRRDGRHLFFQHAPGVRCSAGKVAPGVDVRGDGGYVIDWPSAGLPIVADVEMAEWPPWLLEIVTAQPERPLVVRGARVPDERTVAGLIRAVALAAEGTRNAILFWAACRMAEMVGPIMSAASAAAIMEEAASRCGLPADEARRTIRSAFGRCR